MESGRKSYGNWIESGSGIETRPETESQRLQTERTPLQPMIVDVTQHMRASGFEEWFGETMTSAQDITDFCGETRQSEEYRHVLVFLHNKIVLTSPDADFGSWGFCQTFELPLSPKNSTIISTILDLEPKTLLEIISKYSNR